MTCVNEEYEVEIKMVHEQWLQLKMKFLLGYNMKIAIWWERMNHRWEKSTGEGGFFLVGG